MTFFDFHAHTRPHFVNLNLIKVRDIISIEQLKLTFLDGSLPDELQLFFTLRSDVKITTLNLRNSTLNLLHILKVTTTTYGVRSLRFCCSNLWNSV